MPEGGIAVSSLLCAPGWGIFSSAACFSGTVQPMVSAVGFFPGHPKLYGQLPIATSARRRLSSDLSKANGSFASYSKLLAPMTEECHLSMLRRCLLTLVD